MSNTVSELMQFESQTSYTFLEEIGRGGMGIVYLAERNTGGVMDYVVLKTLKTLNKEDENALRQEAGMAALLRHENIVKTYGLESIPLTALPQPFLESLGALSYIKEQEPLQKKLRRLNFKRKHSKKVARIEGNEGENQLLLIVMDYVDGINLRSLHYEHIYQSLLLPVSFSAFIISRIARALSYAHNYIIHRDISPENILINTQGICKLSDFGIAVATRQQPDYWAGKLSYMAPEQMFNQPIDERIDIFSLGSVAYQLITGIPLVQMKPNLNFEEQVQLARDQLLEGIVPPAEIRKDIPKILSDIIMKMVMLSPYKRYQRAGEVAADLEKKYLYASGYGPTNNALATYLAIFESRFVMYNEEQLQQLSFLKGNSEEIRLKRNLDLNDYTPKAKELLEKRKHSEIYKRLRASAHLKLREAYQEYSEERVPYLKIKYLDNVIEAFPIEEQLTIGASAEMNLSLTGNNICEHHCSVKREDSTVLLKTANQSAYMEINKSPIAEKNLRDGDKIKIGNYALFFIWQKPATTDTSFSLNLDQNIDFSSISSKPQSFLVTLSAQPEPLTNLARLTEHLLTSTNLSELKLGAIPTALVECVQILKEGQEGALQIVITKTAVRLIFRCIGFHPQGYSSLLNNFKTHNARLHEELLQKEQQTEESEFGWEEKLFQETVEAKEEVPVPVEEENEEEELDSDIDIDIDIDNFDTSVLAAKLIVHSFDRIEFVKEPQSRHVNLIVYL